MDKPSDHGGTRDPSTLQAPSADRTSEPVDTDDRIFLAAERLFAAYGFEGVTVREIVQAANTNLAAVNYHFGSKTELHLAVFRKRMRQLNNDRMALLRSAESENGAPSVEGVLRAYIAPPILWRSPAGGRATASRFLVRAFAAPTPELLALLESDVSHLELFRRALERAAPRAGASQISWALHFSGAFPQGCTDMQLKRLVAHSKGACDVEDVTAIVDFAVHFAAAGVIALFAQRPRR